MTDHSDTLLDASWIASRCVDFFSSPLSVVVLDSIDSTNDYLLTHDTRRPTVCLAEQQTAARARTGNRVWYAPPYQNIAMSVSVSFNQSLDQLSALSLVNVDEVLGNKEYGKRIAWLTGGKIMKRFFDAKVLGRKRDLFSRYGLP